jgi:hypothetical protein
MRETIDYSAERSWFAAGDHPLDGRERDRLLKLLQPGEAWSHHVRGRVDGRDAVWVATPTRIAMASFGWRGMAAHVPFDAVAALEVEEGAHGWTIRLDHARGRVALVAAPPTLGRGFVAHLEERTGRTVTFLASRRASQTSWFVTRRATSPAPQGLMPPAAAQVGQAAADATAVGLTAALREAADLHQRGVLSDDEFTALKRKLLGR